MLHAFRRGSPVATKVAPATLSVDPNQYLTQFFAELERLVDGYGTRHAISTTTAGELEVRLGAGDWLLGGAGRPGRRSAQGRTTSRQRREIFSH